jgi:hypothetical protein
MHQSFKITITGNLAVLDAATFVAMSLALKAPTRESIFCAKITLLLPVIQSTVPLNLAPRPQYGKFLLSLL